MKNLIYIATILCLLSCEDSNKEIKNTESHEKQEASIPIENELPSWLIELYPDTIDDDYFSTNKKVTQYIKLNDSVSYCIYKELDGVCLNNYLVVFTNQIETNNYLIEEGCDHDMSFPNYSWSEYKILDNFNIESITYFEVFHDSILDERGMFKIGNSYDNSTLLFDTLTIAYQILKTGEIKVLRSPVNESSTNNVVLLNLDSLTQTNIIAHSLTRCEDSKKIIIDTTLKFTSSDNLLHLPNNWSGELRGELTMLNVSTIIDTKVFKLKGYQSWDVYDKGELFEIIKQRNTDYTEFKYLNHDFLIMKVDDIKNTYELAYHIDESEEYENRWTWFFRFHLDNPEDSQNLICDINYILKQIVKEYDLIKK